MLKIKDNVDFKELEKYAHFEEKQTIEMHDEKGIITTPDYLRWWSNWNIVDAHGLVDYLEINFETREIKANNLDLLYDLILDGLIEKV